MDGATTEGGRANVGQASCLFGGRSRIAEGKQAGCLFYVRKQAGRLFYVLKQAGRLSYS